MHAVGMSLCVAVLASLLFMQLSRNASDWWLAQWSAGNGSDSSAKGRHPNAWYLSVFACIAAFNTVATAGERAFTHRHKVTLA